MQSERLYYQNQYMKSFYACVLDCRKNGAKYEIVLNKTAFFPEGGGQPGDRGMIGEAQVTDTVEKNGEIIHIANAPAEGTVFCAVDFENRFINMQRHSGEQIFSGWVHNLYGYENVGFHMSENEVTVDFSGPLSREQLEEIEEKTNKTIYDNIAIETLLPSSDELKNYEYRSKKEIEGQVRLVKIGNIDLCACCGTHVARTGEIGIVKMTEFENYKGGVRVTLMIGKKALLDYRERNKCIQGVSSLLCAKPLEIDSAAAKLKEKLSDEHQKLVSLKYEYFKLLAKSAEGKTGLVFLDETFAPDDARILADIMQKKCAVAAVFAGSDETGYKYAVASQSTDVRSVADKMNKALSGRGGGRDNMIMGSVNASKEEINSFFLEGGALNE